MGPAIQFHGAKNPFSRRISCQARSQRVSHRATADTPLASKKDAMYFLLTRILIRHRFCESIPQDAQWILKSIVCHLGDNAKSGHYEAYTRFSKHDASPSLWLHLNDRDNPSITQVLKKSCFHHWLYWFAVSLDESVADVHVCVLGCICYSRVYMLEQR